MSAYRLDMSLSTPILTVLSWADAGPARPRAASAISAAEYRASFFGMFLPPMVVFGRHSTDARPTVHYPILFGSSRFCNAPNVALRPWFRRRADAGQPLRRRAKIQQCAGFVVVEFAGLAPLGRAHRHDQFGRLFRRVQRVGIFAGKYRGAHAGA